MTDQALPQSLLLCPRCRRGSLARQRIGFVCEQCSSGFPVVGEVPWLFADPQAMLAEWRGRLRFLLLEIEREVRTLRAECADAQLMPLTRRRLEHLAAAHEDHARRLAALLAPLGLDQSAAGYATHLALRTRLPADQGLTNYYANLHRDWAWGDEENAAALAVLEGLLAPDDAWGRTLVLGAGAGRLAYDIHMQCAPGITIATDFNPLLLFVAREAVSGRALELYEFPIAPRTLDDCAVLRRLLAPQPVREGFHLVAADALRAPFAPASFDTVVTPWFIDIIPEELATFALRVNALLAPGGRWLNFGSLSFAQSARAQRLSPEESFEVVAGAGFAIAKSDEASIPYMRSPASRHGRIETVLAWNARKERDVAAPPEHSALPEWLIRTELPVPLLEDFQMQAASTRIYAFLMSLIDGRRSMRDMARVLVEQRLMTPAEAEPAVRTFLTRMYEDSRQRAGF
ncbi:MAG: methyltransferase domain-containing protein [Pseudomonadota bacterium]